MTIVFAESSCALFGVVVVLSLLLLFFCGPSLVSFCQPPPATPPNHTRDPKPADAGHTRGRKAADPDAQRTGRTLSPNAGLQSRPGDGGARSQTSTNTDGIRKGLTGADTQNPRC